MALPSAFLATLRTHGYNPRSSRHGNDLTYSIVADLVATCPCVATKAAAGSLVYDLNKTLYHQQSDWNNDLVMGKPAGSPVPLTPDEGPMRRATPSTVELAVEHKAVMTEHRKAVKNRCRDLNAYSGHVHAYSNNAVAAGTLVLNISDTFQSPLRPSITTHREPASLIEHCINEIRHIPTRSGTTGSGLEAIGVLVVDMDNVNPATTGYRETAPAPQVGDPLHYDAFIQRLCSEYCARFP